MLCLLLWTGAAAAELTAAGTAAYPEAATPKLAVARIGVRDGIAAFLRSDRQEIPRTAVQLSPPLVAQSLAAPPLVAESDLTRLVALNVDHSLLGTLRDGASVNFSMGDSGDLHLNLYSRRDAKSPGKRWTLNSGPGPAPLASKFWSLGGSIDMVRDSGGHRQIVFVPQLLLDFDVLTGGNHRFQAFFQYANWHPAPGQTARVESIPQVALSLRF